ncbi:MAG: hypothetical protein K2O03_07565, partial [Lachnospiraceae bacterium]|nr:hypothetical protein [Lachnospiraceae bacterium]
SSFSSPPPMLFLYFHISVSGNTCLHSICHHLTFFFAHFQDPECGIHIFFEFCTLFAAGFFHACFSGLQHWFISVSAFANETAQNKKEKISRIPWNSGRNCDKITMLGDFTKSHCPFR